MEQKGTFGELLAKSLDVGDLVEWSKWNSEEGHWESNYGIIVSVKNEIKANRLVSISKVLPIHDNSMELEFFTVSLRLVSQGKVHSTLQ